MVRIADNATIARDSVVRNFSYLEEDHPELQGATNLEWPGDNYLKAAALVWFFLCQEADRQGTDAMLGDDNRPGRVVKGVNHRDAIRLLWPSLHSSDYNRAQQGIFKFLKLGNNYVVLERGIFNKALRTTTGGQYWVASDWVTPDARVVKIDPPGSPRLARSSRTADPVPAPEPDKLEWQEPAQPQEQVEEPRSYLGKAMDLPEIQSADEAPLPPITRKFPTEETTSTDQMVDGWLNEHGEQTPTVVLEQLTQSLKELPDSGVIEFVMLGHAELLRRNSVLRSENRRLNDKIGLIKQAFGE
jgi:hypothetical protein